MTSVSSPGAGQTFDERARAAFLGLALGDAFGRTLEFVSGARVRTLPVEIRAGEFRWTDDTHMALYLAEAVLAHGPGPVDADRFGEAVGEQFSRWLDDPLTHTTSPGTTCLEGARRWRARRDWRTSGVRERAGCGAVMRICPLAIACGGDDLTTAARVSAMVTHAHPNAVEAAVAASHLLRWALEEGRFDSELVERAIAGVRGPWSEGGGSVVRALEAALAEGQRDEPWLDEAAIPEGDGGWLAPSALGLAVAAALRWRGDFAQAVERGARIQGDSDSVACLAGMFLAAADGPSVLPASWLACLPERERIEELAGRLARGERSEIGPVGRAETRALTRELEVVTRAVRAAGELLRAEVARPTGPRGSGSKALVDREIARLLVDELGREFPADAIEIEDEGVQGRAGRSGRAFQIDPHDGTSDFLGRGRRETSISVALVDRGRLVLGVVHAPLATPLTGSGFLAAWTPGGPVLRDGRPVALPAARQALGPGARVLVTCKLESRLSALRAALAPAEVELCASIATRLALVALGEADVGLTNHGVDGYDVAGGQALLQGAGGDLVKGKGDLVVWSGTTVSGWIDSCYGGRDLGLTREVAQRVQAVLTGSKRSEPPASRALATSYGGVLVDGEGRVLLRRRAGRPGWTLPKGRGEPGESPEAAAFREVREETGVSARIVAEIPGAFVGRSTRTRYFLMVSEGPAGSHDEGETAEIAWLPFEEATIRVSESSNATAARDRAVLEAARRVWEARP